MFINFDLKLPKIEQNELNFKKNITRETYMIASKLTDEIITRTRSGRDYSGKPFTSYSLATIEHKREVMAEGIGYVMNPEQVTLTDTGRMMNSIKVTNDTTHSAIIFFSVRDRAIIGYRHQIGDGRLPKREWMTISATQRLWAMEKLNEALR
ncbi:MAG: hypothetical protein RBR14_06530 [Candidatus Cloacimonas acidaminovorans]|nr:hypothetical protein [Candidatus Cloacimonas acidaminovorans]